MASSSNQPNKDGEQESYSAMSVGDVEAVGAHCQMAYCHQLDFLPFRCESCKGTFCLDHRSETAHKCPKAGAWAKARSGVSQTTSTTSQKPNLLTHEQQCYEPSCKALINTPLTTGVQCNGCNRSYCLKHRMKEDHGCDKLTPLGARPGVGINFQNQKEKGFAALDKLRAWGLKKKEATGNALATKEQKRTANNIATINALKRAAKGDDKVPVDKRVYLHVEASADTTKAKFPTGKFFYSRDWSVGRVLDAAAKSLQVQNVNNHGKGEEDKLRVFHVEAGRLLEFSEKVGDALQTGNTVVLLRGVGPAVPDLIS